MENRIGSINEQLLLKGYLCRYRATVRLSSIEDPGGFNQDNSAGQGGRMQSSGGRLRCDIPLKVEGGKPKDRYQGRSLDCKVTLGRGYGCSARTLRSDEVSSRLRRTS